MTDDELTALAAKLRTLVAEWGEAAARAALAQQASLTADLRAQVEALVFLGGAQIGAVTTGDIAGRDLAKDIEGDVTLSDDATINGVAVGVNLGTIIFGRDPTEYERRRLVWYLEGLAAKLVALPLRGLDDNLSRGQHIALPRVYVALATERRVEAVRATRAAVQAYFERDDPTQLLKRAYHPDYALPDAAYYRVDGDGTRHTEEIVLHQAVTALAAVHQQQRLVLLGDPGGGKSTFIRHLAWGLAMYGLQHPDAPPLAGWPAARPLLPILLPLRTLAGELARGGDVEATVYETLCAMLRSYGTDQIDDALRAALSHGTALLLCDGLDEVPTEGAAGVASRVATLRAVRAVAHRYPRCMVVLTCRTRAFDETLQAELGWPVETLAPFTLGQIRHFVAAWYGELVANGQLDQPQAEHLSRVLISAITNPNRPRLRAMAATPLLLTLMALVLYNKGELPRDRPQLYERILELLLGQWDHVREGQSFGHAIGVPSWDSSYIRPLLDHLSYQAHATATSADGRGRLARGDVYTALIDFFRHAGVASPGDTALRCLDYIDQRSGLLVPDGVDSFTFAHLTLQEHGAGREIALNTDDPVSLVMQHRNDDRWREPIFLGMGLAAPLVLDRLLNDLVEREEHAAPKSSERWYRDLILAAELGADRDWSYLRTRPQVRVERWQRALRQGLVALLADRAQPLPVADRVRAGFLLGELGDPRYPVTTEAWQAELAQRNECFGLSTGYWCYVGGGTYQIGGWRKGKPHAAITLPPFWIARSPITVAQYAPFVVEGYGPNAARWWTKLGWQWKQRENRTEPWLWDTSAYRSPNQALVGISWYEATAYCAWLTDQVRTALPDGYVIRLPTEAEWEAAAAYDAQGQRRTYPWGEQELTPELAIFDESKLSRPAPVGCCPAGAAACGALDLAGNVWEWTCSHWEQYPAQSGVMVEDFPSGDAVVSLRGGSWRVSRSYIRCEARDRNHHVGGLGWGGRVIFAPLDIADSRKSDSR